MNPGWVEQYAYMKNIQPGKNYYGLRNRWQSSDKFYKKGNDFLEPITDIGPDAVGGRVRALLIDKADSTHLLAGGISGGVWSSRDGGKSWKAVNEHAVSLSVSCITQNPFNPNEFYYGTGEGMGNSAGIDGAGVFRSTDGGETFTQLASGTGIKSFSTIWDIEYSKTDSSTFYVAVHSGGLYRTTDKGKTFNLVFPTSLSITEILTYNDSIVWAAVNGYGIVSAKETSNIKFNKLSGGLPTSSFGRISFDYCKNYPDVAFAQFLNSGGTAIVACYKSSDHGQNWKAVTKPGNSSTFSWGWYCLNTQISPTDTNFVIATSVNPLYSKNGGSSWSNMYNSHADYHTSCFYPSGREYLVGNDGGVYRYNVLSAATTSADLNNGLNITQFYTGSINSRFPERVMAGAQDNHTQYFDGTKYYDVWGGDGSYNAFSSTQPYYNYVSSQNGEIRRLSSQFSGAVNIKPSGAISFWFINPFEVNAINGNQLFFLTKKRMLVSNNSGSQWNYLTANLPETLLSMGISKDEDPIVYFGGGGTTLYRSDSAGTKLNNEYNLSSTAPSAASGSVINGITVSPWNRGTIYLAMSDISTKGKIWKLQGANGSNCSWEDISGDLPVSLPVNSVEVNASDSNQLIAGTDFGVYTSKNGGINWVKEMSVPNVSVAKVYSNYQTGLVYIFTHGRGIFKTKFKSFASIKDPSKNNQQKVVFNNPVQNSLRLTSDQSILNQNVSINLVSLDGKIVKTDHFRDRAEYDVSSLANGLYILQIKVGEDHFSYRLLKN